MRRRAFIALLAGATAAWPFGAFAQHPRERMRRIGVITNLTADDPEGQARLAAFVQGLQEFGWAVGRNLRIEYRQGVGDGAVASRYAAELVALAPEVILANGGTSLRAVQQITRTVPIVFVQVTDPVGGGFVESLARPGRNATGFIVFEYGMAGKWLELLKQLAPGVTRVAVLRDPTNPSGPAMFGAVQTVAPSFGVEASPIDLREAGELERAVTAFARTPNGGLIAAPNAGATLHRDLIIALSVRHRLPAVYPFRYHVAGGGLISYGPDNLHQHRSAAGYVDRILRGEKPADLPVQAPTKYEMVINLKTANALGLVVPSTLLATADELIE
jgi:putative tryptophan/tyrosine transport system substrate-binding protein